VLALAFLVVACAPIATPTATPRIPSTPAPGQHDRAIAAAEAQTRMRLSQPKELPAGSQLTRVALVNEQPPTLDLEYLIAGSQVILRQRPAQSNPQFPADAQPVELDGLTAHGVLRVSRDGQPVGVELYWTRDGMDYMLGGGLAPEQMAKIARSVIRPGTS